MEPEVVTTPSRTIVGVELPQAGQRPYLILYAWAALAAARHRIANALEPTVVYGVWVKDRQTQATRYVVGLEVPPDPLPQPGLVVVTLPAMRYARLVHVGHIGRIGETYDRLRPYVRDGSDAAWAPTFEVYDTTQPLDDGYRVLLHEPVE